jgi:hypothetical protein
MSGITQTCQLEHAFTVLWDFFTLKISSSFVYSVGYALNYLKRIHVFRLKRTQKPQLCLFAIMAYIYGETHGSVPKPRFVTPSQWSEWSWHLHWNFNNFISSFYSIVLLSLSALLKCADNMILIVFLVIKGPIKQKSYLSSNVFMLAIWRCCKYEVNLKFLIIESYDNFLLMVKLKSKVNTGIA